MSLSSPTRILSCLLWLTGTATADIILTPPLGLNPGDPFRLLFLTGTGMPATSNNIADYDNFVTTSANAVTGLTNLAGASTSIINAQNLLAILGASGVTWQAIVSTSTVNAATHIGAFNVPVFRLNGAMIASSSADLWDGLLTNTVLNDEFGHDHNYPTWTGTGINGLATANPVGSATPTYGLSDYWNSGWIDYQTANNTTEYSLYGLSSVIIFQPVPEPSTWLMLVSGTWLACRLRRKR
jgi:hypothetical protein